MGEPTGKVASVLAAGPLGPFAGAYEERLIRRGYTPVTTAKHVIHLGHLSRWLEVHGMGPADLTRERLGQFVAARQALVGHRGCSLQGLLPLLEILEERVLYRRRVRRSRSLRLRRSRALSGVTWQPSVASRRRQWMLTCRGPGGSSLFTRPAVTWAR